MIVITGGAVLFLLPASLISANKTDWTLPNTRERLFSTDSEGEKREGWKKFVHFTCPKDDIKVFQ